MLFDLLKRTIRSNSNKVILFNQTLRDIENIYRDVGGYDMCYDLYWFFFVLLDFKKGIKEDFAFVVKTKIYSLNVYQKHMLFS